MTDIDRQELDSSSCSQHQAGESEGNHMTIKEKLRIHKEIVESNQRKLKEWKEGRRSA